MNLLPAEEGKRPWWAWNWKRIGDLGNRRRPSTKKTWQRMRELGYKLVTAADQQEWRPIWKQPARANNSRQTQRCALRVAAFKKISDEYPGEPRKQRRVIALALAGNLYRQRRAA